MPRSKPLLSTLACAAIALALGACGTTSRRDAPIPPTMEKDASGRYYLDDGPGPNPPADIDSIPDAVPRLEPLHRGASRPYTVMGRGYAPMANLARYKMRGTATWYGRRYHGKPTSSGEIYDMYAMTAAHTTLPIPSYARVTNLANGKSVIVRINDRGPFIGDRLIDLSYTAAHKLGIVADGSGLVEVETIADYVKKIPSFTFATCVADKGSNHPLKGYVTHHLEAKHLNAGDVDVYLCGPPPMVEAVSQFIGEQGIAPGDRVRSEAAIG